MAKNMTFKDADNLFLEVGAGVESGDAVAVGNITGVALTDADSNNFATVRTKGVFALSVTANDGTAGAAISVGDEIYIQADGSLDVDTGGTLFGYALEAVASDQTETIDVKLKG